MSGRKVSKAQQALDAERLKAARIALGANPEAMGANQTGLIDLLTNLRHWAADQAINFAECDRIAHGHYEAES